MKQTERSRLAGWANQVVRTGPRLDRVALRVLTAGDLR